MRCELGRDYRFEAAHRLPRVPPGHKCARLHGHSYRVSVTLAGEVDPQLGWLIDFAAIDEVVEPIVKEVDHRVLNDLAGLDNPTCEHLARWLWDRIAPGLPQLAAVTVAETPESFCIFRGPAPVAERARP
jgi:6-pyruvoyltetrahydropterin/6-carboxytetrahydropterin synthase